MSKGMIVVDMPEKCCNCRMGFENEYYDQFECYFKPGEEIKPDDGKPDWCPVRPLPERAYHENYCDNGRYDKGWNDCLNKILKEDEG